MADDRQDSTTLLVKGAPDGMQVAMPRTPDSGEVRMWKALAQRRRLRRELPEQLVELIRRQDQERWDIQGADQARRGRPLADTQGRAPFERDREVLESPLQ